MTPKEIRAYAGKCMAVVSVVTETEHEMGGYSPGDGATRYQVDHETVALGVRELEAWADGVSWCLKQFETVPEFADLIREREGHYWERFSKIGKPAS